MTSAGELPRENEADDTSTQTGSRLLPNGFSEKHFVLSLLLIFGIHFIGSSSFPFIPARRMVAIAAAALVLGVFDSERGSSRSGLSVGSPVEYSGS